MSTTESKMINPVIQHMQGGMDFNKAFSLVAHLFNIWHYKSEDRPTYNYLFKQVKRRVTQKMRRQLQCSACPLPYQIPQIKIDYKKMAAHDID